MAGGLSFAVDLVVLIGLVESFGADQVWASVAGYLVALLVEYGTAILWVFAHRRLRHARLAEFGLFVAIGVAGLGVNTLGMVIATSVFDLHYLVAKLPAGLMVLLSTFAARRILLFGDSPARSLAGAPIVLTRASASATALPMSAKIA